MGTRFFLRRSDRLDRFLNRFRWFEASAAVLAALLLVLDFGFEHEPLVFDGEILSLQLACLGLFVSKVICTYFLAPPIELPQSRRTILAKTVVSEAEKKSARSKSGLYAPSIEEKRQPDDLVSRWGEWLRSKWVVRHFLGGMIRARKETILTLLVLFGFAATPFAPDPDQAVLDGVQLALVGYVVLWVFGMIDRAQKLSISPLGIFILTYMMITVGGAFLLMLPRATVEGMNLDFVDALFMSTSASCVTGLSLFDIGAQFTTFGQLVLLVLIQIGGLGIMTFAAFATIAMGSGLSFKDRIAMGEVLNYDTVGRVGRLVAWILLITVACELIGAGLLFGNWVDRTTGETLEFGDQLYYSVFHSISAFCNAGFSLYPDSLVGYQGDLSVMVPMSILIVVGGIGFAVIIDLCRFNPLHSRTARKFRFLRVRFDSKPVPRLMLQTKLVLIMTVLLIFFGSAVFWLLEVDNPATLQGLDLGQQVMGSLFQGGVTPRTAGFNTLDYAEMSPSTQHLTMLLMFIGASPGSTGGGLKTTALAILLLALWNTIRGRPIEAFKRRVREEQVRRVLVMLVIGLVVVNGAIFTLSITETEVMKNALGYQQLSFEVVSAFGTTGLSTGVTDSFSDFGRVVLSFCMFLGRVGPVTLVLSLGSKAKASFDYPHETVMLG